MSTLHHICKINFVEYSISNVNHIRLSTLFWVYFPPSRVLYNVQIEFLRSHVDVVANIRHLVLFSFKQSCCLWSHALFIFNSFITKIIFYNLENHLITKVHFKGYMREWKNFLKKNCIHTICPCNLSIFSNRTNKKPCIKTQQL